MSERLAASCVRALLSAAEHDDRIWVLDGDLADSYSATDFAAAQPDRFIMSGIAEQNMVSMAAGMAAEGARPWVFSFAAFIAYRATDQVRVGLAQTGVPVSLVGSHAGGCGGRNGKTHQSMTDLAVLGAMPGLEIWTPCDPGDVEFAVAAILAGDTPTYLRAPRDGCPRLPGEPGPLRWVTDPSRMILVACGLSVHWALEVREMLQKLGLDCGVLSVAKFSPLPAELGDIIADATMWFVLEDHVQPGGLGEEAVRLSGRLPDAWFGWPRDWTGGSGDSDSLRRSCGLDAECIVGHLVPLISGS